jgi:hypothetical protein
MSPIPEKFLGSGSISPYRSGRTDIFSTTLRLFCRSAIAAFVRSPWLPHCNALLTDLRFPCGDAGLRIALESG